ncbi:MAG: recombinase family protein [Clostridiales bacterium]|nr:recombinase family protein [Clostridiales bacterium]
MKNRASQTIDGTAKRVIGLYRSSIKKNLPDDDLPMQKNACRSFIEKKGWSLVNEYIEDGVSGYKKSVKDRENIQQLLSDAEQGLFDVLLVFMFDRLGRKQDETPQLVLEFIRLGVEVWSVEEGRLKLDDHNDSLYNYLRFWQAEGESRKTSVRVKESHTQMAKQGIYRGGAVPYGYELIASGEYNKKNVNLRKIVQKPDEAKIVKEIYRLALEEGFGGGRIAAWLNEQGILTQKENTWRSTVVNKILSNPIYKGYMAFNKTHASINGQIKSSKDDWILPDHQNLDLVIVSENHWNEVQKLRAKRDPRLFRESNANVEVNYTYERCGSKSPLLFVNMIKCGHCGHPLTTTYKIDKRTLKSGEIKMTKKAQYRCSGKAQKVASCDGQTIYNKKRLESAILNQVYVYLNQVQEVDLGNEVKKAKLIFLDEGNEVLAQSKRKHEKARSELMSLKKEVVKCLSGDSKFSTELLSDLISSKAQEITELQFAYDEMQIAIDEQENMILQTLDAKSYIPNWSEEFEQLNSDKQKMILSELIDNIIVYKDFIDIKLKVPVNEYFKVNGK